MPKKTTKKTAKKVHKKNFWETYKYDLVPGMIGGVIALLFSGSIGLGFMVFLAVLVGTWIGRKLLGDKK